MEPSLTNPMMNACPARTGSHEEQKRRKIKIHFGDHTKNKPARAGWPKRLGLVRATPWADFAVKSNVNNMFHKNTIDRKKPSLPGGFSIYYVPSSRTVCKRNPLEVPGANSSRGVLLHTVT